MKIIYKNNEPEVKKIIEYMGAIAIISRLYSKDLITDKEHDALVEVIQKKYDIVSLVEKLKNKRKED